MKLEVENITKKYKDKTAVDNVSITFTPGVWGLLGANGAGKTTLMRMIAGIMEPTEGKILYDGVPIETLQGEYRRIFGYLPQEFGFYPEFNVQDYLEYMAALKGMPKREAKRKIDELLEQVSLSEVRKKKIVKLSGGMKRIDVVPSASFLKLISFNARSHFTRSEDGILHSQIFPSTSRTNCSVVSFSFSILFLPKAIKPLYASHQAIFT